MLDLESTFELIEGEVKEINANKETLKKNLLDLTELQHILHKTQSFFEEVMHASVIDAIHTSRLEHSYFIQDHNEVQFHTCQLTAAGC